jgi:hypothetical protein
MGMEGDPANGYRGTDEAPPCATVTDVHRDPSGAVNFTAQMDGTHALVRLDNRNVAPDRIWEIDPDYLETFRGFVDRALDGVSAYSNGADEDAAAAAPDAGSAAATPREEACDEFDAPSQTSSSADRHAFQSAVDEQFAALESRVGRVERDMAAAVAELAGDLMRSSRGVELQFCDRYVDRYEAAVHDYRGDHDGHDRGEVDADSSAALDSFRSAQNDRRSRRGEDSAAPSERHQKEKYDWGSVTPLRYDDFTDRTALTDDGT